MTLQDITIGTRLELDMLSKYGEKVGNTLVSQLLEHQEDGTIVISAPIYESRVFYVPSDITVRLIFLHQQHGMLGFTARVISREYRGKIAVLIVRPDNNIEKIQRRMHYRLDIILDVTIIPPENPGGVQAYTKNISGSGVCVISETNFPRNTEVMIILNLSDSLQITAKCIVVRSQTLEIRKGRSYELGMRFTDIRNKDQDALIRFIFEQQRMLLKKDK